MKFILASQLKKLIANAQASDKAIELDKDGPDHFPVVKFFTPDGNATWLFTEARETGSGDLELFGLCDLGQGSPELGYASLKEIEGIRGPMKLAVERDRHFDAEHGLSVFAKAAHANQGITEAPSDLSAAIANDPAPQSAPGDKAAASVQKAKASLEELESKTTESLQIATSLKRPCPFMHQGAYFVAFPKRKTLAEFYSPDSAGYAIGEKGFKVFTGFDLSLDAVSEMEIAMTRALADLLCAEAESKKLETA